MEEDRGEHRDRYRVTEEQAQMGKRDLIDSKNEQVQNIQETGTER